MTKDVLRKMYLEKRSRIKIADVSRLSVDIAARFFSDINIPPGPNILTFIRSSPTNEIDTSAIYYRLWSKRPDVRTCAPRMTRQEKAFDAVTFDRNTEFSENRWVIREPLDGEIISPYEIDIAIVPLLAYDLNGNRVGYGGGFFDRFLAECRPDCIKAGVSYFPPENEIDGVEPTDIRLDLCITPAATYNF